MKYDFKCKECEGTHEVKMVASDFRKIKEDARECPECGGNAFYSFNPGNIQVSYKGFQWADKNYKEKKYRKKRSKYLKTRQKEVNKTWELQPNYKGQRTHNWKEARAEAKKDGKISETYDHLVEKEGSDKSTVFSMNDTES